MLDWSVGDFDQCGWGGGFTFSVTDCDLGQDGLKLFDRFKSTQAVLQIFRNSEPGSVPCGELSKEHTAVLCMLCEHQKKVLAKELKLFIDSGDEFGICAALRPLDPLKNPRVEQGSTSDCDSVTPRDLSHA